MINKNENTDSELNQELVRYKKILKIINFELIILFKHLDTILKIYDYRKMQTPAFLELESLFYEIAKTFSEKAILTFSNIVVDDSDSINIFYLARYYQSTARKFYDQREDSIISYHLQEIETIVNNESNSINDIKEIRDRFIAHIDKVNLKIKVANYPKSLSDSHRLGSKIFHHITTINYFSGIGNEMWDNPSFGICSNIDRILNENKLFIDS